MRGSFEWTAGTTPSRGHRYAFQNNQDAWHVDANEDTTVAVVCDGLGTAPHSEVGAKIGARLVARHVMRRLEHSSDCFSGTSLLLSLSHLRKSVVAQLQVLAESMANGGHLKQVISDYFMFTILGAIVGRRETVLFGSSEGSFWINGISTHLEAHLSPLYIMDWEHSNPAFFLYKQIPTANVESLMLATDGIRAIEAVSESSISGRDERIGSVAQFVLDDVYFRNPFVLGDRLKAINQEVDGVVHSPVVDDTTLVVIRRRPEDTVLAGGA